MKPLPPQWALAEELVSSWLQEKGWRILKRNARTPYSEIDILALSADRDLTAVEVKARSNPSLLEGENILGRAQRRRLGKALLWLERTYRPKRFPVLALAIVDLPISGTQPRSWFPNVQPEA